MSRWGEGLPAQMARGEIVPGNGGRRGKLANVDWGLRQMASVAGVESAWTK